MYLSMVVYFLSNSLVQQTKIINNSTIKVVQLYPKNSFTHRKANTSIGLFTACVALSMMLLIHKLILSKVVNQSDVID